MNSVSVLPLLHYSGSTTFSHINALDSEITSVNLFISRDLISLFEISRDQLNFFNENSVQTQPLKKTRRRKNELKPMH